MARIWRETISPKFLHDQYGMYNGDWFKQMDRCWKSDDGYTVCSRLIRTEIGNVEHATITRHGQTGIGGKVVDPDGNAWNTETMAISFEGERDIPWKIKQEIKNELFGENRTAIEVFPENSRLVDACDVYHLWILPKRFKMPFGIHPKDTKTSTVNRGVPKDITRLVNGGLEMSEARKAVNEIVYHDELF